MAAEKAKIAPFVQPIDNDGYLLNHNDATTKANVAIDYVHHEIHNGNVYKVDDDATLVDEATRELLLITANTTKWIHLLIKRRGTGETKMELFEDPTSSANGTAKTIVQKNRNSSNVPSMLVYHTPTVSVDGTLLSKKLFGEGKKEGGEDRSSDEWILKQNSKYLIKTTSAAADNITSIELVWYELTSINS